MGNQIVICSTFAENDPDLVIRRDGIVEGFREGGRIAIENVGPVVRAANGDYYPAVLDCDGRKWLADESRYPVRVPYEFAAALLIGVANIGRWWATSSLHRSGCW